MKELKKNSADEGEEGEDIDGRAPPTLEELKRWRTEDEVLRLAGAMSPHRMVMLARMRLLARLGSRRIPVQVKAAIVAASGAERSWVKAAVKDVSWWIENTQQGGNIEIGKSGGWICCAINLVSLSR